MRAGKWFHLNRNANSDHNSGHLSDGHKFDICRRALPGVADQMTEEVPSFVARVCGRDLIEFHHAWRTTGFQALGVSMEVLKQDLKGLCFCSQSFFLAPEQHD